MWRRAGQFIDMIHMFSGIRELAFDCCFVGDFLFMTITNTLTPFIQISSYCGINELPHTQSHARMSTRTQTNTNKQLNLCMGDFVGNWLRPDSSEHDQHDGVGCNEKQPQPKHRTLPVPCCLQQHQESNNIPLAVITSLPHTNNHHTCADLHNKHPTPHMLYLLHNTSYLTRCTCCITPHTSHFVSAT